MSMLRPYLGILIKFQCLDVSFDHSATVSHNRYYGPNNTVALENHPMSMKCGTTETENVTFIVNHYSNSANGSVNNTPKILFNSQQNMSTSLNRRIEYDRRYNPSELVISTKQMRSTDAGIYECVIFGRHSMRLSLKAQLIFLGK